MIDYTPDFKRAMQFVLKWEGGFSSIPADKGGDTNQGITQTTYDTYRKLNTLGLQSVKYMTNDERDAIYYYNYWLAAGCDKLEWPQNIVIFDFAVNSGIPRAMRYLGICKNTNDDVLHCLINRREDFYRKIGVGSQRVFLNGWLNRLNSLKREIGWTTEQS